MCIYALQAVAAKSISTNMSCAIAGQKVYSKSAENTTKKTTINHHKVIISSYHSKVSSILPLPNKRRLPHTLLPILTIPNKNG